MVLDENQTVAGGSFQPYSDEKVAGIMVGVPTLSAIGRHVATTAVEDNGLVTVRTGVKAAGAAWDPVAKQWSVQVGADPVTAGILAVTTSARSVTRFLGEGSVAGATASEVKSDVCWALLVAFREPLAALDWDASVLVSPPAPSSAPAGLAWICRNSAKPGRPSPSDDAEPECWVAHATPAWSNPRAGADRQEVAAELLKEFRRVCDIPDSEVEYCEAFRWNNAIPRDPPKIPEKCIVETERRLVAGGDWAAGQRAADAFESGVAVAAAVEGMLE